ncbi:hypothetical protein [Mucilaginibacter sp. PAMB04168]|uniref:hypothetical protein n=1 Tax=Mucilaginibacter sp. PAMB04168 TaxID=3138567 RepID=UPI0031F61F89
MDIFYTIDEKYLQAVEEYKYGESPKSLQLLNEIIAADPTYARAFFHLGLIYYYELKDYQQAGYCFKTCNDLDDRFPDLYEHYIRLLAFLNLERALETIKIKALNIPGVDYTVIWEIAGKHAEKNKQFCLARSCYQEAILTAVTTKRVEDLEESIQRLDGKEQRMAAFRYSVI